jgi:hypothetical protein
MSLLIRDETANAAVLTIDNNGNMAFGDGTPISLVTIAGQEIIDSNGLIVHGLGSCSVNGVSGSVNVGVGQSATISTIPGRVPIFQLDTSYPASQVSVVFTLPPSDPDHDGSGVESVNGRAGIPQHTSAPFNGGFFVDNNDIVDPYFTNPNNQHYDPGWNIAPVGYRWI